MTDWGCGGGATSVEGRDDDLSGSGPVVSGGDGEGPWADALTAMALADGEPASAAISAILDLGDRDCLWPIGEPDDADFRFCRAPRQLGRPYCARHGNKARAGARASHRQRSGG